MPRMSNAHAIQNDADRDAPTDPARDPSLGSDNATLCARIRRWAASSAVPYEARTTLYLAAARVEWLAGRAK